MSDLAALGPLERQLASWQGKIAVAAKAGDGLDSYKEALSWAKNVPSENGLRDLAKREILETAERHLSQTHGPSTLDFVYFSAFPEDATSNSDLDAEITKRDEDAAILAEIERLAKLSLAQYDRERPAAAERMGMRQSTLDKLVKSARPQDTKGQGRAFELPPIEPWPTPVDGAELLTEVCAAISHYVVLPPESVSTLALWALHTHCFDCFGTSPRAAIISPEKGCGKTLTIDVLSCLVARPLPTSNATPAAIFRIIERDAPTLLIDEADTFLKENDELRGILNTGHRRVGQVTRTVGDDHNPRLFSTWAPAAIAMIGRLPDTLNDRSVMSPSKEAVRAGRLLPH